MQKYGRVHAVMQRSWVSREVACVQDDSTATLDYPERLHCWYRVQKRVDDLGEVRMWKHILREPAMPCKACLACLAMLSASHIKTCYSPTQVGTHTQYHRITIRFTPLQLHLVNVTKGYARNIRIQHLCQKQTSQELQMLSLLIVR